MSTAESKPGVVLKQVGMFEKSDPLPIKFVVIEDNGVLQGAVVEELVTSHFQLVQGLFPIEQRNPGNAPSQLPKVCAAGTIGLDGKIIYHHDNTITNGTVVCEPRAEVKAAIEDALSQKTTELRGVSVSEV